jgi:hypothetical protein
VACLISGHCRPWRSSVEQSCAQTLANLLLHTDSSSHCCLAPGDSVLFPLQLCNSLPVSEKGSELLWRFRHDNGDPCRAHPGHRHFLSHENQWPSSAHQRHHRLSGLTSVPHPPSSLACCFCVRYSQLL